MSLPHRQKRQQGVALLEVLIALAIFAIGLSSYMKWYATIAENTRRTIQVVESLELQQELMARLEAGLLKEGNQNTQALGKNIHILAHKKVLSPLNSPSTTSLGSLLSNWTERWSIEASDSEQGTITQFDWVTLRSDSDKQGAQLP